MGNKIIGIFLLFAFACTSQPETGTVTEKDGIITIKVDVDSVKDGKLTDYFEPEIEYLLLKEDENPDSQIGEIEKLIGEIYRNILMRSIGCRCHFKDFTFN